MNIFNLFLKNDKIFYFLQIFSYCHGYHTIHGFGGGRENKKRMMTKYPKNKIYRVISMLLYTHLISLWFPVSEKSMKAVRNNIMPHWEKKPSTFVIQTKKLLQVLYPSIQNQTTGFFIQKCSLNLLTQKSSESWYKKYRKENVIKLSTQLYF